MILYLLGDSVTFGLTVDYKHRFPNLFREKTGAVIRNYGEPGDTTSGMLARLVSEILPRMKQDLKDKEEPRILIMGGANDIIYTGGTATARANTGSMVQHLLSQGFMPYVGIPVSVDESIMPKEWKVLVNPGDLDRGQAEFRAWIKDFASVFNVPLIDMYSIFVDDNDKIRPELFTDGAHPNEEGHRLMADLLHKSLVF